MLTELNYDFNNKPLLIFWELTRACKLKCRHCRADAILNPLPDELTLDEGFNVIDDIKGFGKPYPTLILTGGDPLMKKGFEEIVRYAYENGIPMGIAPTVSELLTEGILKTLLRYDVKHVSISLDGGYPHTHDYIRGLNGHFEATIETLRKLIGLGFNVQVNTLVCRVNVFELPEILNLLLTMNVKVWELFFLVKVGRGVEVEDLTPQEYEDTLHFLFDALSYGVNVRTVEAPFFRRVIILTRSKSDTKNAGVEEIIQKYGLGNLYKKLAAKLEELGHMKIQNVNVGIRRPATRDGYGVIFIAYNGDIYPSGFTPLKLGNVKDESIVDVYRSNKILQTIRLAVFKGRCGICEYRHICGGSRARAFATRGDVLDEDPACIYNPGKQILNS
ncbi:MAG: TIGR04053 family radical SAM/SPASM domain-containing protein [Thaumarchaeota archaeon]|nr:TIGR04053 family radical SAM/SPASM domain-containing protein [Nitrososphaerota archaeon]